MKLSFFMVILGTLLTEVCAVGFHIGIDKDESDGRGKIPHKHKTDGGLSACLLIRDENPKLGEWLGYHWMQGMQHLIVAVDPDSKTSPKDVLDTWKEITGMDIILWNDPDFRYFPIEEDPLKRHRKRQLSFLSECLRHHKAKGRKWSFHIDTDEFIANNVAFGEGQSSIIREDQTLWEYLLNEDIATPPTVNDLRNQGCIHMPRLTFSAVDEQDQEILKNLTVGQLPFETKNFNTLRYYHHADPSKKEHNMYGKTLVNLEHVPFHLINRNALYSIHSPFKELCGVSYQYNERTPFMVHHYIGSWEQFSDRGNLLGKRSREKFEARANHVYNKTYHLQSWLKSFVGRVGLVNSTQLLEGAGTLQKIVDIDAAPLHHMMPDYPTSRGGVESYRYGEEESDWFNFFEANGDRGEVRIVVDENHAENIADKTKTSNTKSCALMLFGLSRGFRKEAFPSIKKFILDANPSCEIFVHTYDIQNESGTQAQANDRTIVATDVLLLTDASKVMIETKGDFQKQVNATFYHQFFPTPSWWNFPISMDNMMMQWHSIAKVWELMAAHEKRIGKRFDRVGYFRLDVIYTHPIPFSDSGEQEQAVIPSMMYQPNRWNGLNDRMFYGRRDFAEVWATHRFGTVQEYMKWQSESSLYGDMKGLHSEDFMRYLLTIHGHLPLRIKNICFKRIRSTGNVTTLDDDCELLRSSVNTDLIANATDFQSSETDLRSRSAPGVIVLGMHRSGTSMLSGLLQNVFSWNVPGSPVVAKLHQSQNAKGFFENLDVVRQNDVWLKEQGKTWDSIKDRFDERLVSPIGENGEIALKEFNDPSHMPWVMKDPRMCITLGAWTPLLESDLETPPVLFIYRNPLEVALSLRARKRNPVSLHEGLQLWIRYNREAIRLSSKMCRVITSNEDVTRDPEEELFAIQDKLSRCGLGPKTYDLGKVSEFFDKSLQHSLDHGNIKMQQGQGCTFAAFEDTNVASQDAAIAVKEKVMYEIAMKVFCDLQSKQAFDDDYKWPDMDKSKWPVIARDFYMSNIIIIIVGTLMYRRYRSAPKLPLFHQRKRGLSRKRE